MPVRPQTGEKAEAWYERLCSRESEVWYTIYECGTLRPIGLTILLGIDSRYRTASFAMGIGEKEDRGKGYGTEATILTLDYGFRDLGLHNIMLRVHSFNEPAIRAYTRAGFRLVGRRRECVRLGDRVYDSLMMECLSTEFESPFPRQRPAAEPAGGPSP